MENSFVHDFAQSVQDDMVKDMPKKIPPFLIPILFTIIMEVIKLMADKCGWFKDINAGVSTVKSPGLLGKWVLKNNIRKVMDDESLYNEYGKQMMTSMLKKAAEAEESTVQNGIKELVSGSLHV